MKLPEKAVHGIYKNNADVIVRMQRHRLVAVVRAQSSDQAYRIACAASDAGIWFVEITFTVPDALGVIERLALRNDLYVGAGTVLSKKDGKQAIEAGARFVVAPSLELDLIPLCHKAGVACFPGAATPTEILTARRMGADLVKIFPADLVGGPYFIKQMQGPFPDVRFMVSGGVSLANVQEYVQIGVTGICLGSAYLGSLLAEKGNGGFVRRDQGVHQTSGGSSSVSSLTPSDSHGKHSPHVGVRRLRPHAAAQRRHHQARGHRSQLSRAVGGRDFLAHDEVRRVRRVGAFHGRFFDRGSAGPPAVHRDPGVSLANVSPPLYFREYGFGHRAPGGFTGQAHGRAGV